MAYKNTPSGSAQLPSWKKDTSCDQPGTQSHSPVVALHAPPPKHKSVFAHQG